MISLVLSGVLIDFSHLTVAGIEVKAASLGELTEESAESYKNVDEVVDSCDQAGVSKKVVKLRSLPVVKG